MRHIKAQKKRIKRKLELIEERAQKGRPNIDEFIDVTGTIIDVLVEALFKIVGNVQYIEFDSTKDTFKAHLNVLSEKVEKIKKEF